MSFNVLTNCDLFNKSTPLNIIEPISKQSINVINKICSSLKEYSEKSHRKNTSKKKTSKLKFFDYKLNIYVKLVNYFILLMIISCDFNELHELMRFYRGSSDVFSNSFKPRYGSVYGSEKGKF